MKLDAKDVAVSLHTALRKGCDSTPTSAAWNLVYLLKNRDWVSVAKQVCIALEDFNPPPVPTTTDWKLMRSISASMYPLVKTRLLKQWQPYGQGHGLVALLCVFELFKDDDWFGFVSFLPHLIPTAEGAHSTTKAGTEAPEETS